MKFKEDVSQLEFEYSKEKRILEGKKQEEIDKTISVLSDKLPMLQKYTRR